MRSLVLFGPAEASWAALCEAVGRWLPHPGPWPLTHVYEEPEMSPAARLLTRAAVNELGAGCTPDVMARLREEFPGVWPSADEADES